MLRILIGFSASQVGQENPEARSWPSIDPYVETIKTCRDYKDMQFVSWFQLHPNKGIMASDTKLHQTSSISMYLRMNIWPAAS